VLREDLGLTGTKEGCGTGECGACTVLVNGWPQLSCLMLAGQLDGATLITIEGMADTAENLHPVQEAFVEHGAVQCGFCTPGMVLTAAEFLARRPEASRREMTEAISGNICRCTGYHRILDGMEAAAAGAVEKKVQQGPRQPLTRMVSSPVASGRPVFFPGSLEELWPLLAEHPQGRVLTGGTDVLVWLRNRRIAPSALISLERIEALRKRGEDEDGVRVGAGMTLAAILDDPLLDSCFPLLTAAVKTLGSPHIRRMASLGGNIVTASPAGDTLPPLYVLGAEVELSSQQGIRRMALSDFILGPGQTALGPGEILSAVFLPRPAEGRWRHHFEKVGLRNAMACAVASFAALLEISADGMVQTARLAWGSVGPTVVRLPMVEAALVGWLLDRQRLETIMPLICQGVAPIDDVRATAAYRRLVAGNLLLRLTAEAHP
jgi:xanthine dehydrogenase small subunit